MNELAPDNSSSFFVKVMIGIAIILIVALYGVYKVFFVSPKDSLPTSVPTSSQESNQNQDDDALAELPSEGLSVDESQLDPQAVAQTKKEIEALFPGVGSASSSPPTSAPKEIPKDEARIEVLPNRLGYLRVRSEPSLNGQVVTQIKPGDQYPFSEKQNGWYHITIDSQTQGWVSAEYVKEVTI